MDSFDSLFQKFIESSKTLAPKTPVEKPIETWRECVRLKKEGWVYDDCKAVPESYDVIVFWTKPGYEKEAVRLNLYNQKKWFRAEKDE